LVFLLAQPHRISSPNSTTKLRIPARQGISLSLSAKLATFASSLAEMVGSYLNGGAAATGAETKLDELRRRLGKADGDPLRVVGVGAGAWGSVFCALLQDAYGRHRDRVQVRVWRRAGRAVDRADAERLFEVINAREDVLRRLIRRCAYLKYVEARLGDRTLHADEILRDGFCFNMLDTPLCPLKVVTNLQEAVWDADIVVNGLPSTETREVFEEIGKYWKERISPPLIISLAKGIEASLDPVPRIITPTQMISNASEFFALWFR
jgi:glycerol-3-phosphate dehydrogenase (NAD+)